MSVPDADLGGPPRRSSGSRWRAGGRATRLAPVSSIILDSEATLADDYERLGAVQIRGLLSPDEVAEIRDEFMAQVEADRSVGFDDRLPADDILARYPRFVHPHRRTDLAMGRLARRWMLDPRIMGRVAAMIGPAFAAQSMFYFKPAGARGQALHQDNLFLQTHPETCIAAWIAIDVCDIANGGLMVVPGSHRYELNCLGEADIDESFTSAGLILPDWMSTVQTTMKAGDVLFFHGSMVHGSNANHSTDRFRRSLIFHYVPQGSTEIAAFYNPRLTQGGDEVVISAAVGGGVCGEGWKPVASH